MVSFHLGHTAVWLCFRKWTDKSEWCCLEGSRKIDKSSRQGLKINKNKVEIACLFFLISFCKHVWNTTFFSLADDRITIRHSRGIESWFHDVDNSKDNNGYISTIALNPNTPIFTYCPSLVRFILYFRAARFPPKGHQHQWHQHRQESTCLGGGDKYRNVKI